MNRQMTQGTVANNVQVIPATKRRVSAGGQLKKAKDITTEALQTAENANTAVFQPMSLPSRLRMRGRKAITRS